MATVVDLLRQLAHDLAPDSEILRGPLVLPPRQISAFALDLPDSLGAHWSTAFGRPTTAQHALALAALRAGETVAFYGGDGLPEQDLLLLVLAQLRGSGATALWLVPDRASGQRAAKLLHQLEQRTMLTWLLLEDAPTRPPFVHVIVATYDELHARLLPFAERAWRWFWRGLRTIAMPDIHHASGLQGIHLRWLLRRATRLTAHKPALVGASAPLAEGSVTIQSLWGRACRIIDSTLGPPEPTLVMLWRCDERYKTLDQLARTLRGRGLSIAVVGRDERDDQVLRARFGEMGIATLGSEAKAAIALVSGVPTDPGAREALLRCGYRMVVMLAADDPHEMLYSNDIEQLVTHPPALIVPDDNLFVTSFHLQAAAAEQPLDPTEIERWHVAERVETLVNKQRLRVLNDNSLQPSDANAELGSLLRGATSNDTFVAVRDPLGVTLASLRPAVADWRGLPGSTWAGDLVVAHRGDDPPTIDLAVDERRRLALAVATYRITPRTKIETRETILGDQSVTATHWNAEIRQRVEGLEEHTINRPPAMPRIAKPLDTRWVAHACAIELATVPATTTSLGWTLKEALSMRTSCASEDVVVTYDAPTRSLWLIETAPGDTGIANWIAEHLEQVLDLARSIARVCEANDLLRTLALRERAWLEVLFDPSFEQPPAPTSPPRSIDPQSTVERSTMPERAAIERPESVHSTPSARSRVYAVSHHITSIRQASDEASLPSNFVDQKQTNEQQLRSIQVQSVDGRGAPPDDGMEQDFEESLAPQQNKTTQEFEEETPAVANEQIEQVVAAEQTGSEQAPADQSDPEHDEPALVQPSNRNLELERTNEQPVVVAQDGVRENVAIHTDDAGEPQPAHTRDERVAIATNEKPGSRTYELPAAMQSQRYVEEAQSAPIEASGTDEQDTAIESSEYDEDAWNAVTPIEAPAGDAIQPSVMITTDEQVSRIDERSAEIEEVRWNTVMEQDEIEDVTWEPNRPAQLPLDQSADLIPPLGRELPALNGPRDARRDRQSAPHGTEQRSNQTPPTNAATARDAARRPEQPPTRPVRSAPSTPGNNRRDNRGEQSQRQPPHPQRPAPSRSERPAPNTTPPRATNDERYRKPPERPPVRQPQESEKPVNVGSMIARMRQLRAERERQHTSSTPPLPTSTPDEDVVLRFRAGQHVRCVPYGEGVVQSSTAVDGREQVQVSFPDIGTLIVDPDINFVRVIEPPTQERDEED